MRGELLKRHRIDRIKNNGHDYPWSVTCLIVEDRILTGMPGGGRELMDGKNLDIL